MAGNEVRILVRAEDHATPTFKNIEHSAGGMGRSLGRVAEIACGFVIGQALFRLPGLMGGAVGAASDLNESMSKMQTVFGDSASGIATWSTTTARNMGISRQAALEVAGTFGNLFTAMGMSQAPAAQMSMDLVKLSGDLASFNNLDPEEVLLKLRAGLVGEAEPMRALGVNMNEATVKAQAMKMGFKEVNGTLTDAQKIQARYAIIMSQTATAQGDFARTAEGAANRGRILAATSANLSAEIGQKLLPAKIALQELMATKLLPALSTGITLFGNLYDKVVALVGVAWDSISSPLGDIAGAIVTLLSAGWDAAVSAWERFAGVLGGAWAATWPTVVETWESLSTAVAGLMTAGWALAVAAWEKFVAAVEALAAAGWPEVVALWERLRIAVAGIDWGPTTSALAAIGGHAKSMASIDYAGWWNKVAAAVAPAVAVLRPLVEGLLRALRQIVTDNIGPMKELGAKFQELGESLKPLQPLLDLLLPVLELLGKALGIFVVSQIAVLVLALRGLAELINLQIKAAILAMTVAVEALTLAIEAVTTVVETALTAWDTAWDAIQKAFHVSWDKVTGTIGGFEKFISGLITGVYNTAEYLGKAVVNGIRDGFVNAIDAVKEAIEAAATKVLEWVKGALGPLAKFLSPASQFGYDVGAGLGLGIVSGLAAMRDPITAALQQNIVLPTLAASAAAAAAILAAGQGGLPGWNYQMPAGVPGSITNWQQFEDWIRTLSPDTYRPPNPYLLPTGPQQTGMPYGGAVNVTVNLNAPGYGTTVPELAEQLRTVLLTQMG